MRPAVKIRSRARAAKIRNTKRLPLLCADYVCRYRLNSCERVIVLVLQ